MENEHRFWYQEWGIHFLLLSHKTPTLSGLKEHCCHLTVLQREVPLAQPVGLTWPGLVLAGWVLS